jgi:hypothetical protein
MQHRSRFSTLPNSRSALQVISSLAVEINREGEKMLCGGVWLCSEVPGHDAILAKHICHQSDGQTFSQAHKRGISDRPAITISAKHDSNIQKIRPLKI